MKSTNIISVLVLLMIFLSCEKGDLDVKNNFRIRQIVKNKDTINFFYKNKKIDFIVEKRVYEYMYDNSSEINENYLISAIDTIHFYYSDDLVVNYHIIRHDKTTSNNMTCDTIYYAIEHSINSKIIKNIGTKSNNSITYKYENNQLTEKRYQATVEDNLSEQINTITYTTNGNINTWERDDNFELIFSDYDNSNNPFIEINKTIGFSYFSSPKMLSTNNPRHVLLRHDFHVVNDLPCDTMKCKYNYNNNNLTEFIEEEIIENTFVGQEVTSKSRIQDTYKFQYEINN